MKAGFGKCKHFNFIQKLFEYISQGSTKEVHIGSDNGFEPTKKQAINSLEAGRSGCYCLNAFFNIVLLIGIFRFSYDYAIRCHET